MKVNYGSGQNVETRGVAASSKFKVLASAHMFHMLSSGLYQDKVTAVLREIGCNAADAHILAGTPDRPFEVKLPNRLDPVFHIKDWGPGLSMDDVMSLYTTYGESTKQDSNDFTGAFGLGSKSPFAYTDSFTVTSVHSGIQRVFAAYMNEAGEPVITLLRGQPASEDWPSGLLVSFPVKPGDFDEFHNKAANVFSWFKTPPVILGSHLSVRPRRYALDVELNFTYDSPALIHDVGSAGASARVEVVGARLRIPESRANLKPIVLMGNVPYPVEVPQLEDGSGARASEVDSLTYCGAALELPIGSVRVTPAREALQYDGNTRALLTSAYVHGWKALGKALYELWQPNGRQPWEVWRDFATVCNNVPVTFRARFPHMMVAAGVAEDEVQRIETIVKNEGARIDASFGAGPPAPLGASSPEEDARKFRIWHYAQWSGKGKITRKEIVAGTCGKKRGVTSCVQYDGKVGIFYCDASRADARIRMAMHNPDGYSEALLVQSQGAASAGDARKEAQRLAAVLGNRPFAAVSELPLPSATQPRGKPQRDGQLHGQANEQTILLLDLVRSPYLRDCVSVKIQDVRDAITCYAVRTRARFDIGSGAEWTDREITPLLSSLRGLKDLPLGINGLAVISPRETERLKKQGWIPLAAAIAKAFDQPEVRARLRELPSAPRGLPAAAGYSRLARQHRLAGVLLWIRQNCPAAWTMVEECPSAEWLARTLESIAVERNSPKNEAGWQMRASVEALISLLPGHLPSPETLGFLTNSALNEEILGAYPLLRFFNLDLIYDADQLRRPENQLQLGSALIALCEGTSLRQEAITWAQAA